MSAYRQPTPPEPPRKKSNAAVWIAGSAGIVFWLVTVVLVLGMVGFVGMILLYATVHAPPHAPSPAPDAALDASAE